MTEALVVAGAFVGGFVSGLTGFGTALTALPLWVQVLPPVLASPLALVCSIVGQVQTIPAIWHAIDFRRLAPFVLPGLLGIPIGVALLPHVPVDAFRAGVGVLLVVGCSVLLFLEVRGSRPSSRSGDAAVGFLGGVLGGLAGLSGILVTLWAQFHGWDKDARRAIFQGYNLSILAAALVVQGVAGILDAELGRLCLYALPATVVGGWLGRKLYGRLDTQAFAKLVLVVLMAGGVGLVATAVLRA